MKASPYPKNNVEIAQAFFDDAYDFILRYDQMIERFFAVKTRRFKCFIDLRSAYECILKAIVAYHQPRDMERGELISVTEGFRHHISSLEKAILSSGHNAFGVEPAGAELDKLPIGLRYALDGIDFRDAKEDKYHATIGSDVWLQRLRDYIVRVRDNVGEELSKHGGVIAAEDFPLEKLLGNEYNKYRK